MKGSTRLSMELFLKIIAIIIVAALAVWLLLGIYGPVITKLSKGVVG